MKSFIRITDWKLDDYNDLFTRTDCLIDGRHSYPMKGKSIAIFFPDTSIRTRMSFELGIKKFGGQLISFPDTTLNKREKLEDVIGYIQNWADAAVIRNSDIDILNELNSYSDIPIINAMTSFNHPCEVVHDVYALKKN